MLKLTSGLLVLVSLGCASNKPWCLERSTALRSAARAIVEADGDGWGQTDYYVFDIAAFSDESLKRLSYKGTSGGHHLFKIYTKCSNSVYAYDIAIPIGQCRVVDPRGVEEEASLRRSDYRKPARRDGRCEVEAEAANPDTGTP